MSAQDELRALIGSYWKPHVITAAAQLGIADALDGAATADELAGKLGVDATALARVLRAMASIGLVEDQGGRFALTELGTVAASVLAYFILDGAWITGALVGLAAAAAAVVGDLAESAIKRDISVKDMSSFLPGHGGILDRIDSMLVAAPVAYVVFALLLGSS